MANCPKESEMLKLLAGELGDSCDAEQVDRLRSHLIHCEVCKPVWKELQQVWGALGRLDDSADRVELTERVLAAVEGVPQQGDENLWLVGWRQPVRAAASILIAIGLGVAAGKVASNRQRQDAQQPPSAEVVVDALGLSVFGVESATGLLEGLEIVADSEAGGDL